MFNLDSVVFNVEALVLYIHPVFHCALLHISGVVGWPSSPAGPLGVSRTIGPLYGPQQTLYSTTHHCHRHDQNVKKIVDSLPILFYLRNDFLKGGKTKPTGHCLLCKIGDLRRCTDHICLAFLHCCVFFSPSSVLLKCLKTVM